MKKRYEIRVKGIVQGVGFRPFVYRMAHSHGLKGSVFNDTEGVLIDAEGRQQEIEAFMDGIRDNPPPLALVQSLDWREKEPAGYDAFVIGQSRISEKRTTFIPPDVMVCHDCFREFFDGSDRRHHYPFITCTHCGPRFSIVSDIPYDRKNTAMEPFPMCPDCRREYDEPLDRRFHTQPDACGTCGPRLSLYRNDHTLMADDTESIARMTLDLLKQGKIVAVKGVGGYLLAADAACDASVESLRRRKGRPFKPFALMAGTLGKIREFLHVSPEEKNLLLSRERPIVILKVKKERVSRMVAPSLSYIGIMLPYAPFQHLLFSLDPGMVLIMTSGNVTDEPIIYRDAEAFARLGRIADYFVTYNREIIAQSDDSVVSVVDGRTCFLRRSRGFVPMPFHFPPQPGQILATGGDLKNSFALARGEVTILSQYLGDLATPAGNELYRRTIGHFRRIYDFEPDTVVSDLHPAYFTTLFADELEEQGLRRIRVQHHHAHIASVMEEHGAGDKVIGIAFDGTGYGSDGTLWGGEFLIADKRDFLRAASFSPFPLPGGESAIREVWKIGLSLLRGTFGERLFADGATPGITDDPQAHHVLEILNKGINSPMACSIGRIFDGVSALLGLSHRISTEAEAAQLLEEAAIKGRSSAPSYEIPLKDNGEIVLSTEELIAFIISLVKKGAGREDIALAFHHSLAASAVRVADILREKHGPGRVALSGGAFQNRLLLTLILRGLKEKKFDILTPRNIPFNDGCIAVGQLAVAKEIMKGG